MNTTNNSTNVHPITLTCFKHPLQTPPILPHDLLLLLLQSPPQLNNMTPPLLMSTILLDSDSTTESETESIFNDEHPNPLTAATEANGPTPPRTPPFTVLQPASQKKHSSKPRAFRVFRSVLRSFPIFNPTCHLNGTVTRMTGSDGHIHGARRMTGTVFGHRKARITISVQENPRSMPVLLLELGIPTAKFMQDMGTGLLRVALECERKADKTKLLDETLWTAFINGKKAGYATKREPTDTDLSIMQLLHAISMGAGVLPADMSDPVDGELTYMRAHFDRVVNSRDSETFYMLNPDVNSGPELSIFFIRI